MHNAYATVARVLWRSVTRTLSWRGHRPGLSTKVQDFATSQSRSFERRIRLPCRYSCRHPIRGWRAEQIPVLWGFGNEGCEDPADCSIPLSIIAIGGE